MTVRELGFETGLPQTSRYFNHRIVDVNGVVSLETWVAPEFLPSTEDNFYSVKAGEAGRLDLISLRFYKTEKLWWVIAYVNNIIDPFREVKVGTRLRILSTTEITNRVFLR